MDIDKNIYTNSGKRIPELNLNQSDYMDKTIVIYGPSKTGKTVITKNIMSILNGSIEQILVVAPSEPSNRSYEGFVNKPFIHYKMDLLNNSTSKRDDWKEKAFHFLESIWKRQEMMASIYTEINKIELHESLFKRIVDPIREEAEQKIQKIKKSQSIIIQDMKQKYPEEQIYKCKIQEINEQCDNILIKLYKDYIAIDYENIWNNDLSKEERLCLQYLHFNPRLLLIFDDCAAQLKPFFSKEIFRKLFYQNRHCFITLIISCQDDTDLPANLRKNTFISFYTEPIVCLSNFERSSNKYSKNTIEYVKEIIPIIFKGYRKMAFIRDDSKNNYFYHCTFDYPYPFIFGSKAMHELCTIVESSGTSIDSSNPFYNYFKI